MEDSPSHSGAQFWPAATSAPEEHFTQCCMLQSGHPGDGIFPEFPVSWTTPWSGNSYGVVESHPMPPAAPAPLPPPHSSSVDLSPQCVRPENYVFGSAPLYDGFSHDEHIQGFISACHRNGLGDGGNSGDVRPRTRNEAGQEHLVDEPPLGTGERESFPSLLRRLKLNKKSLQPYTVTCRHRLSADRTKISPTMASARPSTTLLTLHIRTLH